MAGETPPHCSACETPVGDPEDEIGHPDDPDGPDDPHFVIQERKDGELRAQCTETGQLAAVVAGSKRINPISGEVTGTVEGEGEGGVGEPTPESEPDPQPEPTGGNDSSSQVYDLPEDRDQEDVLMEVVSNESYGLSSEQIKELHNWSQDYDGQMPPDAVQEVLSLMNGVNKQTAKLVRERYELRLNKWIRQQRQEDTGPSIGAGNQRGVKQRGRDTPRPSPTPTPQPDQNTQEPEPSPDPDPEPEDSSRMEARQRRRSRAVDKAVDEFADQFAKNLASDAGSFFSDARDIARTLLKKKAEKDPDWFFEKMEQYDMELVDTVLEPSDARKDELTGGGGGSQPSVDSEIDDALGDIGGGSPEPSQEPKREPTPEETGQNPMRAGPTDEPTTAKPNTPPDDGVNEQEEYEDSEEKEDEFNEIFG